MTPSRHSWFTQNLTGKRQGLARADGAVMPDTDRLLTQQANGNRPMKAQRYTVVLTSDDMLLELAKKVEQLEKS